MAAISAQSMASVCKTAQPPLIGFHCRRMPGGHRLEPWTDDDQLGTPLATALSVSTDEAVPQFHPYAELGEDVGFDQELRRHKMKVGVQGQPCKGSSIASKKCNLFSYLRVNSGNSDGASREPTNYDGSLDQFTGDLIEKFKEVGFNPAVRIHHTGTFPLLKPIHAWTWQKVILPGENEAAFKSTGFVFTRPEQIDKQGSIKQGVLIWLDDSDLPLCKPEMTLTEAVALFRGKLKKPGLLVATESDFNKLLEEQRGACSPPTFTELKVAWRPQATKYSLRKVEPLAQMPPTGGLEPPHKKQRTQRHSPGVTFVSQSQPPARDWASLYRLDSLPKSGREVRTAKLEEEERRAADEEAERRQRDLEEKEQQLYKAHEQANEFLMARMSDAEQAMARPDWSTHLGLRQSIADALRGAYNSVVKQYNILVDFRKKHPLRVSLNQKLGFTRELLRRARTLRQDVAALSKAIQEKLQAKEERRRQKQQRQGMEVRRRKLEAAEARRRQEEREEQEEMMAKAQAKAQRQEKREQKLQKKMEVAMEKARQKAQQKALKEVLNEARICLRTKAILRARAEGKLSKFLAKCGNDAQAAVTKAKLTDAELAALLHPRLSPMPSLNRDVIIDQLITQLVALRDDTSPCWMTRLGLGQPIGPPVVMERQSSAWSESDVPLSTVAKQFPAATAVNRSLPSVLLPDAADGVAQQPLGCYRSLAADGVAQQPLGCYRSLASPVAHRGNLGAPCAVAAEKQEEESEEEEEEEASEEEESEEEESEEEESEEEESEEDWEMESDEDWEMESEIGEFDWEEESE